MVLFEERHAGQFDLLLLVDREAPVRHLLPEDPSDADHGGAR